MMYIRVEYLYNAKATLIKGNSLLDPIAMYQLDEGHNFSATKGVNFFLLFEALSISSGDFVFKIWYNKVSGSGKNQPSTPDYPPGWIDPFNPENSVPLDQPDNPITDITDENGEDTNSVSTECFLDPSKCEGSEVILATNDDEEGGTETQEEGTEVVEEAETPTNTTEPVNPEDLWPDLPDD